MSRETLIHGGTVLTLGERTPNFAQADLLVVDSRISEVGAGLRASDAMTIDATDAIVMPGFVDTHRPQAAAEGKTPVSARDVLR